MLKVHNLSKQYSGNELFSEVSFTLGPSEKLGLVGRNGSGKSTLLKIIQGIEKADEGSIEASKGYRVAVLRQNLSFDAPNILEECRKALPEAEKYDLYKGEKILSGLGFHEEDFLRSPSEFSGGYQLRLELTKALLSSPDLLLLDEPTNYLDVLSVRWLIGFLKNHPASIILVSHDRSFMDGVCEMIAGISRKQLRKIKGITKDYYEQIAEEERVYELTRQNQEKKKKHMEDYVTRFRAKANKARQAQSKLKQFEKMDDMEELATEKSLDFYFRYKECPGKTLVEFKKGYFSYPKKEIFKNLNIPLNQGDVLGVIGENGTGKTTLLKILADELKLTDGYIKNHPKLEKGFYGQTNEKWLQHKNSVVKEILQANDRLTHTEVRAIAGAMMFSGDDADKTISILSGGEKARVMKGKIKAQP